MPNRLKLLGQVRISLRQRNYSNSAEKTYIFWIESFILIQNKCQPDEMGEKEIGQ